MGPDSIMSSALPAGGPSKMSVNTTSASSRSTMRCAVVDPTNPPPTTVTFFLLMPLLIPNKLFLRKPSAFPPPLRLEILSNYRATATPFIFSMIAEANADVPTLVAPGICRFKPPVAIADIRTRRHTEPAHLRRAGIRQIVSIQIGSGQHAVFIRPQEHLLKHGVRDAVVNHQFPLPLPFAVSRENRVERLLHFAINSLLERVGSLFESRLDQRRILFYGKGGILV